MSNYSIPGINPAHEVLVGWDPPLQTYFASVLDSAKGEDEDGYTVLWVGASRFAEIDRVHDLVEKLKPYAEIDRSMIKQLVVDRNRDTA